MSFKTRYLQHSIKFASDSRAEHRKRIKIPVYNERIDRNRKKRAGFLVNIIKR